MRLRQIALVARDLDSVQSQLQYVLGLGEPFHDPGVGTFGLKNAVFALGDTYLEVVSPKESGTSAERYLKRRGGDAGYMAIFQAQDLHAVRQRLERLQVRIVWEIALENAETLHLHPKDMGGVLVSIDAMQPVSSWRWAGADWESRQPEDPSLRIRGVGLCGAEQRAQADRWAALLDCRTAGDQIALHDSEIDFTESQGEGRIDCVTLKCDEAESILERAKSTGLEHDRDSFRICSTRFQLKRVRNS